MADLISVPEFDLTYAGELGDRLFPVLNALRESDPIHWDEKSKCWIVTRHEDISDALQGKVPMSNVRLAQASILVIPREEWATRLPTLMRYAPYHVTNIDPLVHTRMRLLLTKAFSRPVVERIRPYARNTVVELIQRLRDNNEIEFSYVALALPGMVLLKLLGLPDEIYPRLRKWAHDVMQGLGVAQPKQEWVEATDRACSEMTAEMLPLIAERRTRPHRPDDSCLRWSTRRTARTVLAMRRLSGCCMLP